MSENLLQIELFGTLCLRKGEKTMTRFQTRKTGALIAYLAYFDRQLHRRDELIEQLWPNEDLDSSRNRLRIALTWLRKELDSPLETPDSLLISDRSIIYLNPNLYKTDKGDFEGHIKAAACAPNEEEQIQHLKGAASRYRGELLPDFDEAWVRSERHRLADTHLMSLRRLVKLLAQNHDFDEAIDYARHAVQIDQFREESHRLLMRLYGAVGRPAAALRQYYELEDLLREEMRTTPSSATRELAEVIASRQKSRTVANGTHAENGNGAVQTHRVMYANGASANGSSVATVAVSNELPPPLPPLPRPRERRPVLGVIPAQRTPLFGREENVVAVREMLDTPETRLVTLTGMGGCGKTRLALAVAERMNQEFGGTVCFVSLGDLTKPQQIPAAIARALNIEPKGRTPLLEQVAKSMRQPTLLVLDNFEHLAQEGVHLVRTLLDHAPSLSCLITSRQRLNLTCEYEYAVRPLPVPLLAGTPDRLLEFASIQLFADRARNVNPEFQINSENAADVAAICDRMDGIPLAIELAAAWSSILAPAQILERLSTRFSLLTNHNQDVPTRHSSLWAALDWSYTLLEPLVQRFFVRLSVFRGGWDLDAAQLVCQEPNAPYFLLQLHDRSLLQSENVGKKMRFSFLETVREYGAGCLNEAAATEAAQQHANYYLALAEQADEGLRGPDSVTWLNRVNAEHDNLRAALEFLLNSREPQNALKIAASIWRFWYTRGHLAEGYAWLHRSLQQCPDAEPPLRVRALMGAGNIAYERGDYPIARDLYAEALSLRQDMNDERGIASCLNSLGNVAYDTGDYLEAQRLFTDSLNLFRNYTDTRGTACVLSNLANVIGRAGDFATARIHHQEALHLFREIADLPNIALTLNSLAYKILHCADSEAAQPLLEESLRIGRILESRESLARSMMGFAMLATKQGEKERAARLLGAVFTFREDFQGTLTYEAQQDYQNYFEMLQNSLGETTFHRLWEKGRLMRTEQVFSCILEPV